MDSEQEYLIILVFALLSFCGCVFIIAMYLCFSDLRTFSFGLVSHLAVADLIGSVSLMIPHYMGPRLCEAQAYILTVGNLSSVLWVGIIAHSLKSALVTKNDFKVYKKRYLVIGYLIPLVIALGPFFTCDYEDRSKGGGWCWVNKRDGSSKQLMAVWGAVLLYAPLIAIIFYISIVYLQLYYVIKKEQGLPRIKMAGLKLVKRLRLYPIVLAVSYSVALTYRVLGELYPGFRNEQLMIIAAILFALNGLFNAILYGCNRRVRKKVCRRQRNHNDISDKFLEFSYFFIF